MRKLISMIVTVLLISSYAVPVAADTTKPIPIYHWSYISLKTLSNSGLIKEKVVPGQSSYMSHQIVSMIASAMDAIKTTPEKMGHEELSSMRQLINGYKKALERAKHDTDKMKADLEYYAVRGKLASADKTGKGSLKYTKSASKAAESINDFTFRMYAAMAAKQDENILISPYSISSALTMAYAGAMGKTETEIGRLLSIDINIHESMAALIKDLNSVPEQIAKVRTANAIWPAIQEKLKADYTDTARKYYGASLNQLDYLSDPEKARVVINSWIEKNTDGRIKDTIARGVLTKDTPMVLTNAVYFKSGWLEEFAPHSSHAAPFMTTAGKPISTMMMTRTGDSIKYLKADGLEIAELPYKEGRFSMLVLLPADSAAFSKLEETVSPELIKKWTSAMSAKAVRLTMPKFRMEQDFDLVESLSGMGMISAFKPGEADFSRMNGKRNMFIGNVIHKTFIEVAEAGTEAAATTAVIVVRTSLQHEPENIIEFKADRPFIFLIRDNVTGAILFIGRYLHP